MTWKKDGSRRYLSDKPCSRGHIGERYLLNNACVACVQIRNNEFRSAAGRAELRRRKDAWRLDNPLTYLISAARNGSTRRIRKGMAFTITAADISMGECCPCCGNRFQWIERPGAGPRDRTPSIDRFDPREDYVPGNVNVICYRCNRIKDAVYDPEELETIARWMRSELAKRNF